MTGNEIRKSFVDFFKSKEHKHFEIGNQLGIPETEELEVEYSEEDRLKVIEQFVRLRCRYDFAFWVIKGKFNVIYKREKP